MRKYELMIIIHPRHDEKSTSEVNQQISDLLESHGGVVKKVDVWGRRRLAYPIKNQVDGTYVVYKANLEPASLKDIEFPLKLNDDILRYLLVRDLLEDDTEAAEEEVVASAQATEAPQEESAEEEATPEAAPEEAAVAEAEESEVIEATDQATDQATDDDTGEAEETEETEETESQIAA